MAQHLLQSCTIFLLITVIQSAIIESSADGKDIGSKQNHETSQLKPELERLAGHQRFFSSIKMNTLDSANELDSSPAAMDKIDEDPNTALSGVYSDCLVNLSFPCLQRKILVFLDRLGRMAKFNLIGNFLSVVRTAKETRPPITEDTLVARKIDDESTLKTMIDTSVDEFFDSHVLRLALPSALSDGSRSTTSVLDFTIGQEFEEGRMKKKKGGKMKGMKKMMMMGCMMMMGKAAMLGPLIMGFSGLAAIKALIFSTIALTISKIMILKKLKGMMGKGGVSGWTSGGGGGSGGWPSSGSGGNSGGWSSGGGGGGGGGGWTSGGGSDRSFDSHPIVYRGYR